MRPGGLRRRDPALEHRAHDAEQRPACGDERHGLVGHREPPRLDPAPEIADRVRAEGREREVVRDLEPDEEPEEDDSLPVTPRMIVEGMLFVGNAEGKSLPAAKIASHIRNVSANEVDEIVGELNAAYRQDETAYEIISDSAGYRLQLRSDLGILRDQFRGQQRAAKLTPAAIEVLSIVAYRQGVSGEELNKLRGSQSHAILAQLVRRQLVRVERAKEGARVARYHTTSRFNQLFGLSSAADLPRNEDLDDS